ncbi:Exportin-T [Nakaseomyces bracarensis]|uniref:Exportin-T n=1 Tax=Nakaseomyces bracarensis TaxID=273131 RepID=A0ABR4NSC0_9SACH
MLARIREVVGVANGATAADPESRRQAIELFEQIKADPGTAEVFVTLMGDSDDLMRFVALQVLCDQVYGGVLGSSGSEALGFVRGAVIELLRSHVAQNKVEPEFIRNKIAELVTRLFYVMYLDQWSGFFDELVDILSITALVGDHQSTAATPLQFSTVGIDYFCRVCMFINSEIADQTFVRSKEIQQKNNALKDQMRNGDVQKLVGVWINTLRTLALQKEQMIPEIAAMVMSCIGSYIAWIDVTLIVVPEYVSLIINYLDYRDTKTACAQCLCEIISKKMKPVDKLSLLSLLDLTTKVASVDNSVDDVEIYEQLAKLASSVGLELAIILEQCNDINPPTEESQQLFLAADQQVLTQVTPLVLKFMMHEYDSVTQQCFMFISQYLSIMKKIFAIGGKAGSPVAMSSKKQPLDVPHQEFLISLLQVCFKKMKIDESSTEESVDEIEEFCETIRSKLKVFQDAIAIINPQLFLTNISTCIQSLITSNDWRDIELAIYQLHNLSESIRNNLFGLPKNQIVTSEPSMVMNNFIRMLLDNSNIFQMDSSYVQISFFELIVRHYQYLSFSGTKDELLLLNIFCSPFGMFNKREKTRLRTWYLLSRLLKTTKPKFPVPVLREIVEKISPLLPIKILSLNEDGIEENSIFDNQLYLFEALGILIGGNTDSDFDIMNDILTPLFTDLESCISSQSQTKQVTAQCHNILLAIGTLARGVHSGLVPENRVNNALVSKKLIHRSLIEKFANIAEVVLVTFSYFSKHETVRDAARFTFSRLIPILSSDIVPFANKLILLYLESDLKMMEMNDFLSFVGQMIHMFHKDQSCFELFNNLLSPVINKVHVLLSQIEQERCGEENRDWNEAANGKTINGTNGKNIIVTDAFRDKMLLKKSYMGFLQSFVTNNVTSILLTNQGREVLPTILNDLLEYTPQEVQEISVMKLSLNVLVNFVKFFGSGKCNDPEDLYAASVEKLDGLNEFFITKVIPLVFEIPFKPEYKFNIREGSARVIASDLSRLLQELYIQSGGGTDPQANPCLKYLTEVYLPMVQFPTVLIMELVEKLITADSKSFEKYFVQLISNLNA